MRNIRILLLAALGTGIFLSCEEDKEKVLALKPAVITVSNPDQILPIEDSLVRPVLYQNIPSLENLPVEEAKKKFIEAVLPAILISKYRIREDRERIQELLLKSNWTKDDSSFYLDKKETFGAQDIAGLLKRMRTHPNSIVLAQAAVESGWGQSRFFREGNNLFGIWSYRADEPRMEASLTRGENEVHLRQYADISESITDYFQTLGRSRHYTRFRDARSKAVKVQELLPHLKYYSERRMEYILQLQAIIAQNDLTKYDNYSIDPQYLEEEEF